MQKIELTDILNICIQNNLPFFSYRLPQSMMLNTGIQITSELALFDDFEISHDGFIISPFDDRSNSKSLIIRSDITFTANNITESEWKTIKSTKLSTDNKETVTVEISKNEYLKQAADLIAKLQNGNLEKVILSRVINKSEFTCKDAATLYKRVADHYPNAFVSIFHLPGQAIWIGATPETLLNKSGDHIKTMSLAGTKPLLDDIIWTNKERQEQQLVSDYVETILNKYPFQQINIDGPKDHPAGNLTHLLTQYECIGNLQNKELKHLIDELNPTPAVCGIPKAKALHLIRNTELHQREYYAGYLGPVNNQNCNLFVNLRCMKMTSHGISLYVGGGLTAQSVAQDEWQETCLKAQTLLSVLDK